MSHVLINRMTTKTGQRDRVIEKLIESGQQFDANPACLLFLVAESNDRPDDIWVLDLWTTEEEHAKALQAPELQPFIAETIPLLEGPPQQMEVLARGGKGFPKS